ncbi:MAG: pantoate--beta-alanine ligase [Gemmatimonadaceae bacterium]
MRTEATIAGMRDCVRALRAQGARIALVPTMGALHDGHLALVDAARRSADAVVVSIFVNPLQFGPHEDFTRYPRSLAADAAALEARGVASIFAPDVQEMYGHGERTTVTPRPFAGAFEGAVRPGHFTGVLTIVAKLFNIVQPDIGVFGQKDLQQLSLVRAMVSDLDFPLIIEAVETVREADGLAMSSRNQYLSEPDRIRATQLFAALATARSAFARGERDPLELAAEASVVLARDPALGIDYFAVVHPDTFVIPAEAALGDAVVAAVRVGSTRIIDNVTL